ncbi:hypothetical protein LMJF_08_0210 [Leishmania major strain Friedlin]|uniref:Uncharacterized protein n=1 Tax=Leishmania major TaxID=5664 RepID=Q4QIE8_LEIMA|nr:hypothetical protein LMJF_08_0210 [Leishmania major strain Friedlin]CAG9569319.1 hypothetical_protein_-_conserved [Leishmania major strain Friedlin]CAJ02200.1 hypothetical protein LMJF_08_0210 [Leishmania major strain Friedlin]|eukprot:XP_001681050.1 hypothetical protein LMJF_08_0210 [Leishmania major strain Friedlin]
MPPRRRQLHACAGLALRSGRGCCPRPMATRTIYHLPNIPRASCAAASRNHRGPASASEEPLHAIEVHTGAGEGRGGCDSGEGAAEEVVVCAAPPTAPQLASAVTRGRGDGGAVRTLKRHLRPYEEEGSGAVLPERELDGTAAPPPRHICLKPAELDTDVWHGSGDIEEVRPHTSADGRRAGRGRTATAEHRRGDCTSDYARGTRSRHCLPAQKKFRCDATPTPASCAAATHNFEERCDAAFAERGCVAVAVFSRPPDSRALEDARPSSPLLLPSSPVSTNSSETSAPRSSTWAATCCRRRDSGDEDDDLFRCSTTTTTTSASEIDSDGRPEDGHSSLLQGVLVECEARSAGSGSGLQLAMPRHLAVQQSSAGEVLQDRPLIAAPPSSEQNTAAPTNCGSSKIARLTNFYLEPRYRRHAQHMALHDLPLATSTTVSSLSSTPSSAFLPLFTASPPSCPVACGVKRDAASCTGDDEIGMRSPIWSIIMKYYAAHHERQLPPHAAL